MIDVVTSCQPYGWMLEKGSFKMPAKVFQVLLHYFQGDFNLECRMDPFLSPTSSLREKFQDPLLAEKFCWFQKLNQERGHDHETVQKEMNPSSSKSSYYYWPK